MVLEIKNVKHRYGKKTALNNVTIRFEPGVYGILGPNGAGKSTLLNLLTDNVKRDKGEILWDGKEILELGKKYRKLVGYMPQQQRMYEKFGARMFLQYMAELKMIPKKEARVRIDELLKVVHLEENASSPIGSFSGGMKQRLLLAQALLGDPKILILDEPTAGLDPKERISIRNFISELSKDRIILFATHVVSDIECIADKVVMINNGEILGCDSPRALIASVNGHVGQRACSKEEIESYREKYPVHNLLQNEEGLIIRVVKEKLPEEFVMTNENITLEDVYLYYFEEKR